MYKKHSALAPALLASAMLAIGWLNSSAVRAVAAIKAYGSCQSISLPVALGADEPANQVVSATYCQPRTWAPGPREVDVLTPGATYDQAYWDWPVDPATYSYVDKTLQAGRATLDYDRVGTGMSSHPLSAQITIGAEAYVLHQVVAWVRAQQDYAQVNLVGHSLGSVISIQEAGLYQDVSRVVLTGLLHAPNVGAGFATTLASLMHPAALDPQFAASGLDAGYLTTDPGARGAAFYAAAADPAVVSYDEAHKDVVPATDLSTLSTTWALPPGQNASDFITAPVLVVIGEQDVIFCADPPALDCSQHSQLAASEAPYYSAAKSLTIDAVAATGHDVALHPSAAESFAEINQWIESH